MALRFQRGMTDDVSIIYTNKSKFLGVLAWCSEKKEFCWIQGENVVIYPGEMKEIVKYAEELKAV